jgi:Fe-S-cluster-containing dehydrogenase component
MKKYAFIIDIAKCENCNNCFLSCKDEHCDNSWPGYSRPQPLHGHRWMNIRQKERGVFPYIDIAYLPQPCMHCDDPPCQVVGKGAVYKREDGIVLIDPDKGKGCKELVTACPYGAIWWNEEEQLPQKCTLCAHLLDGGWPEPRCVQSCPTGAMSVLYGTAEELRKTVIEEELAILPEAEKRTSRPRCYYKNLHRYSHCFIAGSLAEYVDNVEECVVGAKVLLKQNEVLVAEQVSDDFGDFKFDCLQENSGEYKVEIVVAGEVIGEQLIALRQSCSVGTIILEKQVAV